MALSKETSDHQEIRQWAESRGAIPSEVAATHSTDEPGILRFQFPRAPKKNDQALREISWDDFFSKFDERNLTLLYQDKTASGRKSNFNKLVCADEKAPSHNSKKRSAGEAHGHSAQRADDRKKA